MAFDIKAAFAWLVLRQSEKNLNVIFVAVFFDIPIYLTWFDKFSISMKVGHTWSSRTATDMSYVYV